MKIKKKIKFESFKNIFLYIFFVITLSCILIVFNLNCSKKPSWSQGFEKRRIYEKWIIAEEVDKQDLCVKAHQQYNGWTVLIISSQKPEKYHPQCFYVMKNELYNTTDTDEVKAHDRIIAYSLAIKLNAKWIYLPYIGSDVESWTRGDHFKTEQYHKELVLNVSSKDFDSYIHSQFRCNNFENQMSTATLPYSICLQYCSYNAPVLQTDIQVLCRNNNCVCAPDVPLITYGDDMLVGFTEFNSLYHHKMFWALPILSNNKHPATCFTWKSVLNHALLTLGGPVLKNIQTGKSINSSYLICGHNNVSGYFPYMSDIHVCETITLKECILKLLVFLSADNVLKKKYNYWLNKLDDLDYIWPKKDNAICDSKVCIGHMTNCSPSHYSNNKNHSAAYSYSPAADLFGEICPHMPRNNLLKKPSNMLSEFWNILVIIIFNQLMIHILPYLEVIYRPHFPNQIYCVPDIYTLEDLQPMFKRFPYLTFMFFPYPQRHRPIAALNYKCISQAIALNYNVSGYMVIMDDMLVSVSKLKKMLEIKDKFWHFDQSHVDRIDVMSNNWCDGNNRHKRHKWWPITQAHKINILYALKSMQRTKTILLSVLNNSSRVSSCVFFGYFISDFIFIPSSYALKFSALVEFYMSFEVDHEVAVPTILRLLVEEEHIQIIDALMLGGQHERNRVIEEPDKVLNKASILHPFKWGTILSNKKMQTIFCKHVIPNFV